MEFGGYKTVQLLGKGGMSEVYEVEDASTGSRYALKLFTYAKEEASVRARFEAEGRLLAKLNHPRVVKVRSIGVEKDSGSPYFVMDLVLDDKGKVSSLGDVEGAVDEETIGRWYDDVREGLAYIHGKGIIHRDLKLQNILIGPDGHAVITDFGISKVVRPDDGKDAVINPVQTIIQLKSGQKPLMGSIGYMAPELEMGVAASPQSDWFALGVIVYKLLTGVWCDARTDVVGALDTYDPVWGRIIPKLLHSNPQGRECLSYAEEKRRDLEAREFELEEKWLKEKARAHLARHVARYVGGVALALVAGLAWLGHEFCAQRDVWRLKMENAGVRQRVPGFEELFQVPDKASDEEQEDDSGNVTMYSRSQFEAAKVDALVLTHGIFSGLQSGNVTPEKARREFERFYKQLGEESLTDPFDNLHFGDEIYGQLGESGPLRMLFGQAIEKLKKVAE